MCGGCGRPLMGASPDAATEQIYAAHGHPLTPQGQDTYPETVYGQDATTYYTRQANAEQTDPYLRVAPYAPYAPGQPPAYAPARRKSRGRRVLAILLGVLAVLVILVCSAWAFVIRPPLHRALDSRLRSELISATSNMPVVPAALGTLSFSVTEQELNSAIALRMPANAQVQDLTVHFAPGNQMIVDFRAAGLENTVRTRLTAQNGRIVTGDTHVLGPLGLVESGSEMQAALNTSLGHVPAQDYVDSLSTGAGTMSIVLHG